MDARHFDVLVRRLASPRRSLLAMLATLPLFGGLELLAPPEEAAAKDRRRRRKTRNKRRRDPGKRNGKGKKNNKNSQVTCVPETVAQTCQGRCGQVANNCQQTVDCGTCTCVPPCGACQRCAGTRCIACSSCCDGVCCERDTAVCHATTGSCCVPASKAQTCDGACGMTVDNCGRDVDCGPCTCEPACPACQVCDASNGECVPDAGQDGDACGETGQVCQADGTCACEAGSCPECTTCENDGLCSPCADCCDGSGVCQPGTADNACGSSGACEMCPSGEWCQGQTCVCKPNCDGKQCGPDGCGGQCGSCRSCETCQSDGTCLSTCSNGRICSRLISGFDSCCYPAGTPNSCTNENYAQVCCAGVTVGCINGSICTDRIV